MSASVKLCSEMVRPPHNKLVPYNHKTVSKVLAGSGHDWTANTDFAPTGAPLALRLALGCRELLTGRRQPALQ